MRNLFILGFLVVAAMLALGALVSDNDGGDRLDTAAPPASGIDGAATVESQAEALRVTATLQPPPGTARPNPTETPQPSGTSEPARAGADFSGTWTVNYTITDGAGAGESYAFDVSLEQDGSSIRGGNDGVLIMGVTDGQSATLTYRQPGLGYTATFTVTLVDAMWGGGAFTSAVNSGTSRVQRVR